MSLDASPPPSQPNGPAAEPRCFLCGRPFRRGVGEPIDAGEGVELCVGCGAFQCLPGGCC